MKKPPKETTVVKATVHYRESARERQARLDREAAARHARFLHTLDRIDRERAGWEAWRMIRIRNSAASRFSHKKRGIAGGSYRCPSCGAWHITRSRNPVPPRDLEVVS